VYRKSPVSVSAGTLAILMQVYSCFPHSIRIVLLLAQEIYLDFGSGGTGGHRTLRCLWLVTIVFQLKINKAVVQLCICVFNLILLFSVMCFVIRALLTFYFRLLQAAHIESDNWWKVVDAFIETWFWQYLFVFLRKDSPEIRDHMLSVKVEPFLCVDKSTLIRL
jgi:hypothetical protein